MRLRQDHLTVGRAEASQYIKLNPAEMAKYSAFWSTASDGAERLSGADAVAFLSRAEKVSKGQLRRIWDIADHRKEGELDESQFYIALRLVALAQRGAALSTDGLRSFTGITLVPNIAPPPKEEEESGPSIEPASATELTFSWTISQEVAKKYDSFFASLDERGVGMLDGRQGAAFFGKSGLPRPTLKRVWDLADVTRDGLLSRDEFRTAMHIVASITNKRLTVTALPNNLDPTGPNWLRIAGEGAPEPQQREDTSHLSPQQQSISMPPASELSPMQQPIAMPPPSYPSPSQQPIAMPPPPADSPSQQPISLPPPSQAFPMHHAVQSSSGDSPRQIPTAVQPSQSPNMSQAQYSTSQQTLQTPQLSRQEKEAEIMLEALRKERLEIERTRREIDEMKAEMQRMRLEKESTAQPAVAPSNPQSNMNTRAAVSNPFPDNAIPAVPPPGPPVSSTPLTGFQALTKPQDQSQQPVAKADPSTPPKTPTPEPGIKTDLGPEDDIWDQPSPKASALPGPGTLPASSSAPVQTADSVSSDDDDDFWGAGGMGAKPSLGPSGGQKPGASKGFGGSELDDWVF